MTAIPSGFSPLYSLRGVSSVVDNDTLNLGGAYATTIAEIGSSTYLFASGSDDDGISVFSIGSDASLTGVYDLADDTSLFLNNTYALDTIEISGTTFLIAVGSEGVQVFSVASDGSLTATDSLTGGGDLLINTPLSVTSATVDGTPFLFVPGYRDSGLSVFSISSSGVLTNVENVADTSTLKIAGPYASTTLENSGGTFLVVAGANDSGLTVFSVASDGSLTATDLYGDSTSVPLWRPQFLASVEVEGKSFFILSSLESSASGEEDGITVFEVDSDGYLTITDSLFDNDDLALDSPWGLATATQDGTTILFAAGRNDEGVSVFSIASDGSLTLVTNAYDTDSILLQYSRGIEAYEAGGKIHLVTANYGEDDPFDPADAEDSGLQVFSLEMAAIDLVDASDTGTLHDDETADTTPTIAYSVEAGAFVRIDWGDGRGFVSVADGTGAPQEITLDVAYTTDGTKTITVESESVDGVVSTASLDITIATPPPDAPTLGLDPTTDSGLEDDGLTSDIPQLVSGTAEAGSTVEVFEGSTSLGTTTADAFSGGWSLEVSLAEGTHDLTATATNPAGATSEASSAFSLTCLSPLKLCHYFSVTGGIEDGSEAVFG